MPMITYAGEPVAVVGATRAYLAPTIEDADDGDPRRRFVAAMCLYAFDVAAGRIPGPYSNVRAELYARCVLIDDAELAHYHHEADAQLAVRFQVPPEEIAAKRRD